MAQSTSRKKSKVIPPIQFALLAQFPTDAAADASSASGMATKGSMYYDTTLDKVKVKEGSTWKTVTTS